MIRWVREFGIGHLMVGPVTACGLEVSGANEEAHDAAVLSERPFGADTCHSCHGDAKRWFTGMLPMPDVLKVALADVPPGARRLTAAERMAALQGRSTPQPAPVPVAAPDDFDMEFPPEDLPTAVVGGALLVKPTRPKRLAKTEDFSDIDSG